MVEVSIGTSDTTAVVPPGLFVDGVVGVTIVVTPLRPVSMVMTVVTAEIPEGKETVAAFGKVVVVVAVCGGELAVGPTMVDPPVTTVKPPVKIVVPPVTMVEPAETALLPLGGLAMRTATVTVIGGAGLSPGVKLEMTPGVLIVETDGCGNTVPVAPVGFDPLAGSEARTGTVNVDTEPFATIVLTMVAGGEATGGGDDCVMVEGPLPVIVCAVPGIRMVTVDTTPFARLVVIMVVDN